MAVWTRKLVRPVAAAGLTPARARPRAAAAAAGPTTAWRPSPSWWRSPSSLSSRSSSLSWSGFAQVSVRTHQHPAAAHTLMDRVATQRRTVLPLPPPPVRAPCAAATAFVPSLHSSAPRTPKEETDAANNAVVSPPRATKTDWSWSCVRACVHVELHCRWQRGVGHGVHQPHVRAINMCNQRAWSQPNAQTPSVLSPHAHGLHLTI